MASAEGQSPPAPHDVTGDGGVVRTTVLQEGQGECPPRGAQCQVHYVARLVPKEPASEGELEAASSSAPVMDTRQESLEPKRVTAGVPEVPTDRGLALAVQHMRKGERSWFRISHQYAYGEEGSFSFPSVPPCADLDYEVELLDYETLDEEEASPGSMIFEERLKAAEKRRLTGNDFFKAGDYARAADMYRRALMFVTEDLMLEVQQLADKYYEQALAVWNPVHLNLAACGLAVGTREGWNDAISHASEVLKHDIKSVKAFFRRGVARRHLGQLQGAKEDLEKALSLDPKDRAVASELAKVQAEQRDTERASAGLFRGKFEKGLGFQNQRRPEDHELRPMDKERSGDDAAASGPSGISTLSGELHSTIRERVVQGRRGSLWREGRAEGSPKHDTRATAGFLGALWDSVLETLWSALRFFTGSAADGAEASGEGAGQGAPARGGR